MYIMMTSKKWYENDKNIIIPAAAQCSRLVTHVNTLWPLRCLSARIGRDAEGSSRYGRRWNSSFLIGLCTPHLRISLRHFWIWPLTPFTPENWPVSTTAYHSYCHIIVCETWCHLQWVVGYKCIKCSICNRQWNEFVTFQLWYIQLHSTW